MALLNPFRIGQGMLNQPPYPYGSLGADKMPYWDGNQLRIPSFTPKPWEFITPDSGSPSVPSAAQMEQPTSGILGGVYGGGDGGAGNSVGGGPAPSAAPDQQGVPDGFGQAQTGMQPGGFGVSNPSGPTAPAPGMAPAQGLAVGEVDPQGPSGAASTGKGTTGKSEQQAANQAAAEAAADAKGISKAAMDKAVQEKGLIDAFKESMQPGFVDMSPTPTQAENAPGAKSDRADDLPGVSPSFADHPSVTGKGSTGSGGTGESGVGPGGAGDHQGADNPGQGPGGIGGAGDAPYRKGGFVGDDGDNKLEARRGILHEREFVINPEMAKALQKHAPGLLHKMDRAQKMMMRR